MAIACLTVRDCILGLRSRGPARTSSCTRSNPPRYATTYKRMTLGQLRSSAYKQWRTLEGYYVVNKPPLVMFSLALLYFGRLFSDLIYFLSFGHCFSTHNTAYWIWGFNYDMLFHACVDLVILQGLDLRPFANPPHYKAIYNTTDNNVGRLFSELIYFLLVSHCFSYRTRLHIGFEVLPNAFSYISGPANTFGFWPINKVIYKQWRTWGVTTGCTPPPPLSLPFGSLERYL